MCNKASLATKVNLIRLSFTRLPGEAGEKRGFLEALGRRHISPLRLCLVSAPTCLSFLPHLSPLPSSLFISSLSAVSTIRPPGCSSLPRAFLGLHRRLHFSKHLPHHKLWEAASVSHWNLGAEDLSVVGAQ